MNLWQRLIGKKQTTAPVEFHGVVTDMHSHLIPGIDDGAPNMEMVLEILGLMSKLGYKKVITTPHIMSDLYVNNATIIRNGEAEVKEAIQKAGIPIEFSAAAEYLIDEGFSKHLEAKELMTMGDNYVLVELPYFSPPPNLKSVLFELQLAGFKVILAHPERYSYWHNHFSTLEDLKDRSVFFQVNIISLSGHYSEKIRKVSQKLIEADMIDFLGSDVHSLQYFNLIEKTRQEPLLQKLLNSGRLKNPSL